MRKAAELLIKADGNLDKLFYTRRRETRELDAAGAPESIRKSRRRSGRWVYSAYPLSWRSTTDAKMCRSAS